MPELNIRAFRARTMIQGDSWFLDWYEFLTCVNAIFLVQESHFSLDHGSFWTAFSHFGP
jgi:hypothetical protein